MIQCGLCCNNLMFFVVFKNLKGHWYRTKDLCAKGRDWIIQEIKTSGKLELFYMNRTIEYRLERRRKKNNEKKKC
jgi:hypothetical protein